jgi:hypothetical protein
MSGTLNTVEDFVQYGFLQTRHLNFGLYEVAEFLDWRNCDYILMKKPSLSRAVYVTVFQANDNITFSDSENLSLQVLGDSYFS